MRDQGELDTQIYGKVQSDMAAVKKSHVNPKSFPVNAAEIKYPPNALNTGSLLYRTSNMNYGAQIPNAQDLPCKFLPVIIPSCREVLS